MEFLSTQERTRPVVFILGQGCQTILVVEDERFVRDVTCELLSEVGYHVLSAESATVAKGFFFPGMQQIDLAQLSQLQALFGFFVMIFVFKSCVFIMAI